MNKLYNIAVHCNCKIYYKPHNDNKYILYTESNAWYSKEQRSCSILNSDIGYPPDKELNHGKYDFKIAFYSNYDNSLIAKATPESYPMLSAIKLETAEEDNIQNSGTDDSDTSIPTNPVKVKIEDILAQAQQFEKDNKLDSAAETYKTIVINYPASKYAPMCMKKKQLFF